MIRISPRPAPDSAVPGRARAPIAADATVRRLRAAAQQRPIACSLRLAPTRLDFEGAHVPQESRKQAVAVHRTVESMSAAYAEPQRRRPQTSRLADGLAFLSGFMARPLEVASVVPSSVFLEQRVVRAADLANARCVVELGPGTGGTTRALLRALAPQARLLAVELNPTFSARLRRRIDDARLIVQAGRAEALAEHLAQWSLPAPDVVISGIPFSTLPPEAARQVAAAVESCLAPGGRVVAYQVRPHVATYIAKHLGEPRQSWEWRNVPPMRVFRWVKSAAPGR